MAHPWFPIKPGEDTDPIFLPQFWREKLAIEKKLVHFEGHPPPPALEWSNGMWQFTCTTNDKSELSVTHNERESFGALRLSVQLWQYFLGPSNWKNLPGNEACGGRRQSPINIDTSKVQFNESLGKFIFTGYSTNPSRMTLLNNGHGGEIHKNTPFSWMIKGYIFYLLMSKR